MSLPDPQKELGMGELKPPLVEMSPAKSLFSIVYPEEQL
jgi:hypothetical protein